jgi:hypothetical protein
LWPRLSRRTTSAGVFRLRGNTLAWGEAWNMPGGFMGDFVANVAPRDRTCNLA